MEEDHSEEKVGHLKSLNAMLLKQTVEKRQQIDSLETELARGGSERGELRRELDQVGDENLGLRMELGIVMDFVGCRFREIGVGVRERDDEIRALKGERDMERGEVRRLEESVAVMAEKEASLEMVIEGLKGEKEKRRMGEEIVNKAREEIDELKREMKVLLGVKNEMEIVKSDQRGEIDELERKLGRLNDTVESLRKEEKVLRDMVVGLEKDLDESIEKERGMMVKIDAIGKEKMVKESELERLMVEKSSVEKQVEIVNEQCSDKEKLIDKLSRELEERVFSGEAKRVELNRKVDELERAVAALQKERTETNEKLSCKVREIRDALEQVELERERADKALDEEKRHGEDLKADVSKSEKMIETTLEELEKVKTERESLSTARDDLEKQSKSLRSEKAILEKELLERTKAIDALKKEVESAGMDAERSLVMMLKSAASAVSQSDSKQETATASYASELESIGKAFKNKENIIEEMKKEAESMKQSTEEANKKKSFWTVVSSVTTIFAAASFAYASRTR
ncbi:Prefoldin chaperone subunit family protein [Raphanus sativus]|nr:Prefoldin chaperone subunit family protein [Raphanus sativus]